MNYGIPQNDDNTFSKCSMYAVNFTEMLSQGINKPDPSWPQQACKYGWEFNFTEIPYETISTEVRLII